MFVVGGNEIIEEEEEEEGWGGVGVGVWGLGGGGWGYSCDIIVVINQTQITTMVNSNLMGMKLNVDRIHMCFMKPA